MSTGITSLEQVPIELEASERSRSSSQASARRSVLDTEIGSITDRHDASSTEKDKENLERLLNIFNGGHGLNMGYTVVCAIKARQSLVTAPDTDEARKALDILRASIAGYFTRQKTRLKKARQDIKKRVTLNDPEKGPTEIRLTQRVKTFYVDKWPEIKDIDIKDTRDAVIIPHHPTKSARARNMAGGTPISKETAMALRRITLGTVVHSFSKEWRKSGLLFHDISSKMAYGLQTLKCGSQAMVLCFQGFLLKHLLFARQYQSAIVSVNALQPSELEPRKALCSAICDVLWRAGSAVRSCVCLPSEFERRKALCSAICDVLWRAGSSIRCCVCLAQDITYFGTDWQYRADGITEKISLYEFKNFKDLEMFVKRHVSHFEHENTNGCILLLYSLILSRTIQMVYDDMDVVMTDDNMETLLTGNEECTINLINLLLTGRATKNLHNGNVHYDNEGKMLKTPLRGIKERTQVGLLFWDKDEDPDERTELGSMLKTPKYPIWLTLVNGRWGLLFSLNMDLVSDWRVEHRFTLYYYTGLAHQVPTPLTIDTRYLRRNRNRPKSGIIQKMREEKIPALEQCIMTKWYDANIDWHGVFPYI